MHSYCSVMATVNGHCISATNCQFQCLACQYSVHTCCRLAWKCQLRPPLQSHAWRSQDFIFASMAGLFAVLSTILMVSAHYSPYANTMRTQK